MSPQTQEGNQVTGAQSEGHQILGNNFSAGGDNVININNNGGDDRKRCLAALFSTYPVDDRAKYLSFRGEVIGVAFQWVLDLPLYRAWLSSESGSELLWIYGGPGTGKTMLSVFLSSELERRPECVVLYYFCESRDPKRNTAVLILRGLIYSLVRQRPFLMKYLLPDFEVQESSLFESDSVEPLWRIFVSMIGDASVGTVYCIIDALDECHGDMEHLQHVLQSIRTFFTKRELQEHLERLNLEKQAALKMLLISRDEPNYIRTELDEFPVIPLEIVPESKKEHGADGLQSENLHSGDRLRSLELYLDAKLDAFVARRKCSIDVKNSLRETLQRGGDGTFLWIDMVFAQLLKTPDLDLSKASLLNGAVGMYALTLLQIPQKMVELARSILRWITVAFRPLTLCEIDALGTFVYGRDRWHQLQEAIRNGPDDNDNRTYGGLRTILDQCKNLLDVNDNLEVKLPHETAKAFLTDAASPLLSDPRIVDFHVNEAMVHADVARSCVSCIEASPYDKKWVHLLSAEDDPWSNKKIEADEVTVQRFPFLLYATVHLPGHLRKAQKGSINFSSPFFDTRHKYLQNWFASAWSCIYHRDADLADHGQTLLHVAAYFNLVEIAEHLSERPDFEKTMTKHNSSYNNPPFLALEQGSREVLAIFLDHGVTRYDINRPFITIACRRGHRALVELLLDRGDSPNIMQKEEHMAVKGFRSLVRHVPEKWLHDYAKLFENRVDAAIIEMARLDYGGQIRPLHAAASTGQDEIVRLLLERGADSLVTTTTGWTALHFAAVSGQPSMIKLLVRKGVPLDDVTLKGWTALHCSAWRGRVEGAECLLSGGARVDIADKAGETPLHVAAARGEIETARALIRHGASRDVKNHRGLTPLQRIASAASPALRELLEPESDQKRTRS